MRENICCSGYPNCAHNMTTQPKMSEHKCELCGTPVKVVGKTTKHYEPIRPAASVPSNSEKDYCYNKGFASGFGEGQKAGLDLVIAERKLKNPIYILPNLPSRKIKEPQWPDEIKPEILTGIFNMDRVKASEYINAMRIACIKAWKDAQG